MRSKPRLVVDQQSILRTAGGFSLVGALAALTIIAILASIGVVAIRGQADSLRETKLKTDIANLNAAVKLFRASGGRFDPVSDPRAIVERLKTAAAATQFKRLVGLRGEMADPRLTPVMQTNAEAASNQSRARWDMDTQRFIIFNEGAPGVKKFILDDRLADKPSTVMDRDMVLQYADRGSWVWNYEDRNLPAEPTPQDFAGGAPPAGGPIPPPDPGPSKLQPPRFSPPPGIYALTDFRLSVSLTDPNLPGTSQTLYSVDGGGWSVYTGGPIEIDPGTTISVASATLDPDRWSDSDPVDGGYSANPVTPQLALSVPNPVVTYANVGGSMVGGGAAPAGPGVITLVNSASIPPLYQNDSVFTVHWTYDGSDPLNSGTRQDGDSFLDGFPGQEFDYLLARWSAGDTLSIKVAAQSRDAELVTDSEVVSTDLTIAPMPLRAPIIPEFFTGPNRSVTISLDTSFGDMPEGARIFYTSDGSDPGSDGSGNPLSGTEYLGPVELSVAPGTELAARVYGPPTHPHWFIPSPLSTREATPAAIGFSMGVAIAE